MAMGVFSAIYIWHWMYLVRQYHKLWLEHPRLVKSIGICEPFTENHCLPASETNPRSPYGYIFIQLVALVALGHPTTPLSATSWALK